MVNKMLLLLITGCLSVISFAQTAPPAAGEILQQAFGKAKAENKNVFIIFHASWCSWCHKMDSAINDPVRKSFFENNYVIRHLTLLESHDKKQL